MLSGLEYVCALRWMSKDLLDDLDLASTSYTRMFIIWSIFGLVERIMKKTTSLGSESIPNVKNKNFALESFFLMISCKILKRLKNLDLV